MTERITISLPDEMASDINSQLSYGDNRSEWVREAIEMRLAREAGTAGDGSEAEPAARTAETADPVTLPDDLEAEIDRWQSEMKRNDVDDIETRVRAARAVGQLVVNGGVSRSEAIEQLLPEHEWGSSDDTWWQKAGKRRFSEVESIQWDQSAQEYQVVD
jgi:Arc/MetJ-type ribon-helix-helix transcriptional regulator